MALYDPSPLRIPAQPLLRQEDGLGAALDAEFAEDGGQVGLHRRLGHATSGGVVHSPQANRLITRCRRYAQLACLRYCTHVFAVAPELRSQVKGLDGEGQTDGTVSEGSIGGRCACSHERTAWSTSIAFLRWGD